MPPAPARYTRRLRTQNRDTAIVQNERGLGTMRQTAAVYVCVCVCV